MAKRDRTQMALDKLAEAVEDPHGKVAAAALTKALRSRTNLVVAAGAPGVTLPTAGAPGQSVEVGWTVTNTGLAVTPVSSWSDRVWLSANTTVGGGDVSLKVRTDEQIGKVSIIGAGMRSHPGVAAKVFEVLGGEGINIEMISTSPIKISCVISADRVPDAVKALHEAFELGADAVKAEDPMGADHRPTVA